MNRRRLLAWIAISWFLTVSPTASGDFRPSVHIFGAEECVYCRNALTFLRQLSTERGDFDVHEYDVVRSSDAATLFFRFITMAGLRDPHVPMIVIGRDITLGFESDASTGQDIRRQIETCRTAKCPDQMRTFIDWAFPAEAASYFQWTVRTRWAEAAARF
jgi:glutaredoxin